MENVKNYFLNKQGYLHREDGPAREFKDGTKEWFINGKRHREDGPACIYSNGYKLWYLYGNFYSEQDWETEVAKIKLKRILDL